MTTLDRIQLLRDVARHAAAAADALARAGSDAAPGDASPVWKRLSVTRSDLVRLTRAFEPAPEGADAPAWSARAAATAEVVVRRSGTPAHPLDVSEGAPRLAAHLDACGVRVIGLEQVRADVEALFLDLGDRIAAAIQRWPLTLAVMDAVKHPLNPPPVRARRMVMLRRQARRTVDEVAARLGRTVEEVRTFEHTGRGLSDAELAAIESWLGRLVDDCTPGEMAAVLGIAESDYRRYEQHGTGLTEAQVAILDAWLTRRAEVIGAPLYGATPLRRIAARYGVDWSGIIGQLRAVYDAVLAPLVAAGVLDGVRLSRIGSLDPDDDALRIPPDIWTPEAGRAPPGAPTPDVLLHLWAAPDPLVKRYLSGQWLTYAVLARLRAHPRAAGLDILHDLVVSLPLLGQERQTAINVVAAGAGGALAVETITMRQSDQVRRHVRHAAEVLGALTADPRRRIVVVMDAAAIGEATVWSRCTVIPPTAIDAALDRAFAAGGA